MNRFITWCEANILSVNVSKTKEIIFDFRKKKTPSLSFSTNGEVEITDSYKCLGLTINNKFTCNENLDIIVKKTNQRGYFLRKLKLFNADKAIISIVYSSTIESLFSFGIVSYGGNIAKYQIARINSVMKSDAKIINQEPSYFHNLDTASISP